MYVPYGFFLIIQQNIDGVTTTQLVGFSDQLSCDKIMSQSLSVIRYICVSWPKETFTGRRNKTVTYANAITDTPAEIKLERLVSTHGDGLLRYCHSILLDYHEAQDVVQTTFIKTFAKLSEPNASATHGSWLYRIAYTNCIDIIRRKKLQRLFARTEKETTYTPEYFMSENVNRILAKLPPKERALVYSRAVEGLDYHELENIYGASAQTLRKRYERARSKLLKIMHKGDELT